MVLSNVVRVGETWTETDEMRQLQESALKIVHLALETEGLAERHLKELISLGLWKWTEAGGQSPNAKYNTRFVSAGVMHADTPMQVNHEHVFTRKSIIADLRESRPDEARVREMLESRGVACIVSVEEHARLGGASGSGWERYLDAGVEVYDRATGELASLHPTDNADGGRSPRAASGRHTATTATDEQQLIDTHVKPELRAPMYQLLGLVGAAECVAVPHEPRDDSAPKWLRLHDTRVEEPTRAAAFLNFNGNVDYALREVEVPEWLASHSAVEVRENERTYRLRCRLRTEEDVVAALSLLELALSRLRDEWYDKI